MDTKEHLLTVLAEECAEVQQEVCKTLRFGGTDKDNRPNGKLTTNAQNIEIEFIEAMAVRDMLKELGVLADLDNSAEIYANKKLRVLSYMEYAKTKVVVEPTKPKHNCIENGCIDGRYTGCYNNGGYLEITVTCTVCGKVLRKSRKPPKTH